MRIRIRDLESFGPWIRDGKIRIWDKHPGSATLPTVYNGFIFARIYRYPYWKWTAQHATKSWMGSGSDRFRIFFLPTKKADIHVFVLIQSTGESEATCRMSRLPKSTSSQVCPIRRNLCPVILYFYWNTVFYLSLIFHRCCSTIPPLSPLFFCPVYRI